MAKVAEQYTELDKLRHSCSHVLAQAVKRKFPKAKLGIGPPIGDGFFYDIQFPEPISEDGLKDLETEMEKVIKADYTFEKKVISAAEAKKLFKEKGEDFKLEIIEIATKGGEELSIVVDGDFTDLCKYPH